MGTSIQVAAEYKQEKQEKEKEREREREREGRERERERGKDGGCLLQFIDPIAVSEKSLLNFCTPDLRS